MSGKSLSGAVNETFDNLNVQENELVRGNLTVLGTIIGNTQTPTVNAGFYTATDSTNQYRTTAGTLDLVTTSANPLVRVLNNSNSSNGSTLQVGKIEGDYTSSTVQRSIQRNSTTAITAGAGFLAESDSSTSISMTAYSSNHQVFPGRSVIETNEPNGLIINSSQSGSNLRLQIGSVDELVITPTTITTSNAVTTGDLTSANTNLSGTLTVSNTSTLNGPVLLTDTAAVVGAGTGAVRASGGIYSAKEIMGNFGLYIPYGQPLGTFGNTLCNTYLKSTFNLSGGVSNDGVYLYAPGSTAGAASANNTTDYVLGANASQVRLKQTTQSTSTTTGALVISGGVGIAGNLNVGGSISGGSISYGSTTTGTMTVTSSNQSTSTTTGALQVVGGVGIQGNLYVGGSVVAGAISYASTTTGTLTVTTNTNISDLFSGAGGAGFVPSGALQITGGVSIGRDVFINQDLACRILRLLMPIGGQFSGIALWPNSNGAASTEWLIGLNAELRPSVGDVLQIKQATGAVGFEMGPKGSTFLNQQVTPPTTVSSATNNLTLDSGQLIICTSTGVATVVLPNATLYDRPGSVIRIVHRMTPSQSVLTIQDAGNNVIDTISNFGSQIMVTCTNIGSVAGVWIVNQKTGTPLNVTGQTTNSYTPAAHTITNTGTGGITNTAFLTPNNTANQAESTLLFGVNTSTRQCGQLSYVHDSAEGNRKVRLGFFGGPCMDYTTDGSISLSQGGISLSQGSISVSQGDVTISQGTIGFGQGTFKYREGSWVPNLAVINYASGIVDPLTTITYHARSGSWTRMGRMVTVSFYISFSYGPRFDGTTIVITGWPIEPQAGAVLPAARLSVENTELTGFSKPYGIEYMPAPGYLIPGPGGGVYVRGFYFSGPSGIFSTRISGASNQLVQGSISYQCSESTPYL